MIGLAVAFVALAICLPVAFWVAFCGKPRKPACQHRTVLYSDPLQCKDCGETLR